MIFKKLDLPDWISHNNGENVCHLKNENTIQIPVSLTTLETPQSWTLTTFDKKQDISIVMSPFIKNYVQCHTNISAEIRIEVAIKLSRFICNNLFFISTRTSDICRRITK